MKIGVKLETIRDVMEAAGLRPHALAESLGLSAGSITMKLKGTRPWFTDELSRLTKVVNGTGRMTVTEDQLIRLAGPRRVKVRGYVGQ